MKKHFKRPIKRDKVISISINNGKDIVGVWVEDDEGHEVLLAELHPDKADKLIAYWNKL